ncbi:MAG: MbnH family di-heme enzyme [Steroidobacter sp.]
MRIIALLICGATAAAAPNPDSYDWRLPPAFPPPFAPADNSMSDAKVALGCRLFFEPRLSVTGEHSCASCHRPELAFTDGRARAHGATGIVLARGAMGLANVAYSPALTWVDKKIVTLEAQMEQPLFSEHPPEMGLKRDDAALRSLLSQDAAYARAFAAAFPDEPNAMSMQNLIRALASFERTLISGRSAFDRYIYDDARAALSATAKHGMELFFSQRTGCAACHSGLNFSGPIVHRSTPNAAAAFANNGLDLTDAVRDAGFDHGVMDVTHQEDGRSRFRVPTLRNIELTAPYMHDGRLATLEAVIDHYISAGQAVSNERADPVRPSIRRFDLTTAEQQALIEFLKSLTDVEFVSRDWSACGDSASIRSP